MSCRYAQPMSPLAAVCPVHGAFNASFAIRVTGDAPITLEGNTMQCPHCGRLSRVIDGVYRKSADGMLYAVSAPSWAHEALREVQEPLMRASAYLADPARSEAAARKAVQDAIAAIAPHQPKVAEELRKALAGRTRFWLSAWVEKFLAVVGGAVTVREGARLTAEIIEAIRHVTEMLS